MEMSTFLTMSAAGGEPAGYVEPDSGSASPLQLCDAPLHSLALLHQKKHQLLLGRSRTTSTIHNVNSAFAESRQIRMRVV